MVKNIAAIDIGTHTARLLVAEGCKGEAVRLSPLARERAYIRLADQVARFPGKKILDDGAASGVVRAISGFLRAAESYRVEELDAVATGILREVENGSEFLKRVQQKAGIPIRLLTGGEEARLTEKGVLHAFPTQASPFLIFDLGGGSTEFVLREAGAQTVRSISVGAAGLTRRFFSSDPPRESELEEASRHVDLSLQGAFPGFEKKSSFAVIAAGGTAVTLASVLGGVPLNEIVSGRMNGRMVEGAEAETFFHKAKRLDSGERLRLFALERGRADVILAGALAVIRILRFFRSARYALSVSDLLEGVLLERLEGVERRSGSRAGGLGQS